jgi:LuxR family transcriptional regulator, maltose regulon positive regulatory protein
MNESLLTTKLIIPPARPQFVPRPRLVRRLREALGFSFVLVSAPAGFGKTTLLSEWARKDPKGIMPLWVSLDEGDNDPVRFWDYFIAALEKLQPGVGQRSRVLLHSPRPLPLESVLLTLINDAAAIDGVFAVILDDYQFIKTQPIHAGVAFLLEHLPPRMRMVIAARADPPLPLALFRGRGMMLEIDADDLRFTEGEAISLLREMRGAELPREVIGALNARTEGWPAGLKMAALSLRRQQDIPAFVSSFTGTQRYVMDYLLEQVLRQQPEEVQGFLLKTSVVNRLSAPLCDTLTGRTDSRELLGVLDRDNIFIVPLDQSREWYRYEDLFAELLRHQLELSSGLEVVSRLHLQASLWFEQHGFPYESVRHSLAAQDWDRALGMIYGISQRQMKTGEVATLLNWLQEVPETVLRSYPLLLCNYVAALMSAWQLDAAERALMGLETMSQKDSGLQGRVLAYKALIASFRLDMVKTVELSEKALPLLPADALELRVALSLNLGRLKYQAGLFNEAEPLLHEAYETAQRDGSYWNVAWALSILGSISFWHGRLQEAIDLNREAIRMAGQSPAADVPYVGLGEIMYELNDLEAAAAHLEKALELSRLFGIQAYHEITYGYLSRIRLARGDNAGAREAMEGIDRLFENDKSPPARAARAGRRFQFALAINDQSGMAEWGQRFLEYGDSAPFYLRQYIARLKMAQGQNLLPEERHILTSGQNEWLSPEWQKMWVTLRIYRALFEPRADLALRYLAEALAKARPLGLVRTFVDEGLLLAPLLRKAISRGIEPDYAARLLTIVEAEQRLKFRGRPGPDRGVLSGRELDVIKLVEAGLSDKKIAERLFISVNTAKTHLRHIFDKLNAESRLEAVARAREQKLI